MRIIGVDYGDKKTGIAFAEGPLAEPIEVLYHDNEEEFIIKLLEVINRLQPELIAIGMPERDQGKKVQEVIEIIKRNISLPIEAVDEGFSTLEAQLLSREAGVRRKKRRSMEDAYSASIILQKYLDSMI